jgi:predicted MPP superfamily phosphohydrolase
VGSSQEREDAAASTDAAASSCEPGRISRREFLKVSAAVVTPLFLGTGYYSWQVEPHWLEIVKRRMPVRALPRVLEAARLVQLSDLHVGPVVSDEYVLDTFRRVAALRPDIVVMTGDLTSYAADVLAHARRIYAHLPHGRLATLCTLGNHDYGPGWRHYDDADRLAEAMRESGVRVLRNDIADVGGLQIVGMDELWADRFDPVRALAALDPRQAMLALSHNPDTVDLPGWDGFQSWVLAGHTHGGQVKPPFLPPPILGVRNRRYTAGEFGLSGGRRMYINRGVGHLQQIRFDCRPEVTLFELHRA